jgi:hypothetical protein
MTPKQFSASLAEIASSARHHPEPGLAVSLLAQLLLDFSVTFEETLTKYHTLLRSTDSYEKLTELATQALAEFELIENPVKKSSAAFDELLLASNSYADLEAKVTKSMGAVTPGTVAALTALIDPALTGAPEFAADETTATTTG